MNKDLILSTVDSYVRNRMNACLAREKAKIDPMYQKQADSYSDCAKEDYNFLSLMLTETGGAEEKVAGFVGGGENTPASVKQNRRELEGAPHQTP